MAVPVLIALAAVLGAAVGGLLGYLGGRASRRPGSRIPGDEEAALRRKAAELARELQTMREERSREAGVTSMIPVIVRNLGTAQTPAAIPAVGVRLAKEFFKAVQVGFFAPRRSDGEMVLLEGAGFPPDWKGIRPFSPADGILGAATQSQIVVMQDDYGNGRDARIPAPSTLEAAGIRPDLVVPVIWKEQVFGAIVICGSASPCARERRYASMFGDLVAWALQNMSAIASADLVAATDHLTGIPNRAHFAERFEAELRKARSYSQPLSIVVFDVDHFKSVNDTHGHHAGDVVLKRIAEMIRSATRGSNLFARYGGEEFVVMMVSADGEQAARNANRIRETVAQTPFHLPGQEEPVRVTISGGVASFPGDGDSTSELIRAADQALYAAKEQGRNRIVAAARTGFDGKPI